MVGSSRLDGQIAIAEDWELPRGKKARKLLKQIERPLWTEAKAALIAEYLFLFVQITKHGTYIDGFAGPQRAEQPGMWAAKLVLEREPRWLRNFFLCDKDPSQVALLQDLVAEQPNDNGRKIKVLSGDFNDRVFDVLNSGIVTERQATFCLLDQRMFECRWSTLEALARHKRDRKIELFYFLPIGWLNRSIAAKRDRSEVCEWWGSEAIDELCEAENTEKGILAANRIEQELGYSYAYSWPIRARGHNGRMMYAMIHASDHPDAPDLMQRAYDRAVNPPEPFDEVQMALFPR